MKVGTIIVCLNKDDLVNTMVELAKCGIQTEFNYSIPGHRFCLEVTEIET